MSKMYYSETERLYACWQDNSRLLLIAHNPNEHEIESHIFYSDNAVKQHLNERGFKRIV